MSARTNVYTYVRTYDAASFFCCHIRFLGCALSFNSGTQVHAFYEVYNMCNSSTHSLSCAQVHTFYEAAGCMVSAHPDAGSRAFLTGACVRACLSPVFCVLINRLIGYLRTDWCMLVARPHLIDNAAFMCTQPELHTTTVVFIAPPSTYISRINIYAHRTPLQSAS